VLQRVSQYVAACVAACCSVDKETHADTAQAIRDFFIPEGCSMLQHVAACCSVCRSMLQYVLQRVAVWTKRLTPTQKKRSVTSFGDFLALK